MSAKGVILLSIIIAGFGCFTNASVAQATTVVPAQFIAKLYSEALGRAPDQGGWNAYVGYFAANGCSFTTLRTIGMEFFTSNEFNSRGYDNEAKILALYRGAFSREPDLGGYEAYYQFLLQGNSWRTAVENVFNSQEFSSKVSSICGGGSYGWSANHPVINVRHTSPVSMTGSELQAILNNTPYGQTVYLEPKIVVRLDTTLTIPSGVTLATLGGLHPNWYAAMARVVRNSNFSGNGQPLIVLNRGSKLDGVWVDGQRHARQYRLFDINIRVIDEVLTANPTNPAYLNSNIYVINSRISDSSGWTNLEAGYEYGGVVKLCGTVYIQSNLVTSYSATHTGGYYTDGLSVRCQKTYVEYNHVVDATDVGIVMFRYPSAIYSQQSLVRNNSVLNAGNSAYGGFVVDTIDSDPGLPIYSFVGSSVSNNIMWTSDTAHMDIAVSVGSRAWNFQNGTGASGQNNTSGILSVRAKSGIVVSGMLSANVTGNTISWLYVNTGNTCQSGAVIASVTAGFASGNIQTPNSDLDIGAGCVAHG